MIALSELVKEVSEKVGIPEEEVENALRHKFNWLREKMVNLEDVAFFDSHFGTFQISKKRVKSFVTKFPENEEYQKILKRL